MQSITQILKSNLMKFSLTFKICALAILFFYNSYSSSAQIVEGEKKLKEKTKNEKFDSTGAWHYGGTFNNTFSQTGLVNWTSGGQNSISINSLLSLYAYKKINKTLWENNLDLSFGVQRQGSGDSIPLLKSDDKIDFSAKIGQEISKNLYYAGYMNFRTQFANGFDDPNDRNVISRFMAPGYWVTAIGINSTPKKGVSIFVAPLTSKITFVYDQTLADAGAFGVLGAGETDQSGTLLTVGKNVRYELGGYLKVGYKGDVAKNISITNQVDLFSNYLKNPQNIDVNWQFLMSMKVNEFISCTFSSHLIYDDDIDIMVDNGDGTFSNGPRVQFKEVFGAGLSYKFSSAKKKVKAEK